MTDYALEVACPYENCGAGEGMQCLVHHNDDSAPSIRDNPHVVRVRKAREEGYEPDYLADVREADTLEEKVEIEQRNTEQ